VADDIEAQTAQTLANVEALLRAAGASLDNVVSCLVHLRDLDDFESFNRVYEARFGDPKPVRTTVGAELVAGMRVEITVVARRPG
jgi:enamine deaminase RidA (YjgF/YER057c/UK114 family)